MKKGLEETSNILIVLSGKGGVGKSTVAVQLAVGMWERGLRVGLLDIDFCGPSIPRIMGIEHEKVHVCPEGWMPVFADGDSQRLGVISIGCLLEKPQSAVIWRGPRKSGMVDELLHSVCWGPLDCLIIDTPPGTSDEHLSVLNQLQQLSSEKQTRAIVVSTPQRVSLCDVRRELGFCIKTKLQVAGLIENMSGYRCSNCSQCSNVFSSGGAEALALEKCIPFLGRVPIDPRLTQLCDSADDFGVKSAISEYMNPILEAVFQQCQNLKSCLSNGIDIS